MNYPNHTDSAPTLQEVLSPEQALPPQQESPAPPTGGARRGTDQDLAEFRRAFPLIYDRAMRDPKYIPHEVWELVRQGMSLTDAYLTYLEDQQTQNARNARRATGSMRSAGRSAAVTDPFLLGFESR